MRRFKTWIVLPMAIAVVGSLVLWGGFQYRQARSEMLGQVSRLLEQGHYYRDRLLERKSRLLQTHAWHLTRDPELIAAWRNRDREALLAYTAPLAAALRDDFGITHFYLVEPDRTVFLRPYNPGRIGGTIQRHTMLTAVSTGAAACGIELGSSGTLTLRYVTPWSHQGELLGYIELGVGTDRLLREMAAALHVEMFSIINKSFTSRDNFEAGRERFGFSGNWDEFPEQVVIYQTMPDLPAGLRSWLATGHEPHGGPEEFFFRAQGRHWWGGVLHQQDGAGRDVADLVILHDITGLMTAFRRNTLSSMGLAAVLLGIIMVLLYAMTRRAEREVALALEQIRHQATHDPLTGLPNRELFQDRLRQSLSRAAREEQALAVLHLDLDNFKAVNNKFGQGNGDAILRAIARCLQEALREEDTVARFGGDEFVILLPELKECLQGARVARKILGLFDHPITVDQLPPLHIGASLGIACLPNDGKDSETLLRHAEMAMYQAKRAGRGSYAYFDSELNQHLHDELLIHSRLKTAMADNRLELHYQPLVTVRDNRMVGVEALLRWQDEELGTVSPDSFVLVAEATGLIIPLGDWVLNAACRQLAKWHQAGLQLKIAVNLSAYQFRQAGLVKRLADILAATGAPPRQLELEVTETAVMENLETTARQLKALSSLGVSISLDDFGTGHSSLAYLKALPIDKIKIDRSFIRDLSSEESNRVIVRAVLGMAQNLALQVVAEGVETEEQLTFVREHGCQYYQGWLFARALPATQLEALLQSSSQSPS